MTRNASGLVVALLVFTNAARADEKPTIDDVKKAWKARQDAHKSFRVEWVATVTMKAGALDYVPDLNTPGPHPPKDTEYKAVCSFASDDDKAASSIEDSIYSMITKTWCPAAAAIYFDGNCRVRVDPLSFSGWAQVSIGTGKLPLGTGLDSYINGPVLRLYRPLGGGAFSAFPFEEYKLSGRTEKIRGATCVEIDRKNPPANPDHGHWLWCDPERGFLPVRVRQRYGDGYDLDWEYRKDDTGQWVPTGWQYTSLNGKGALRYSVKAEVKKIDFTPKFAADAFAPKAPVSSHVVVYKDGEKQDEYLIRPDGSKRALLAAERRKSYQDRKSVV